MADAPFEVPRAHRWFAVELNNLAWDLVEAPQRSADEIERMIHAAHGACFHWMQVGTLLNHLRAECLLATAYAVAGLREGAIWHAERCLALSHEAGDTQTPFDRATAHGAAANAFAVANRPNDSRDQYRLAKAVADTFTDADDLKVFEKLYPPPA